MPFDVSKLDGAGEAALWFGRKVLGNVQATVRFRGQIEVDGPGPADGVLQFDLAFRVALKDGAPAFDLVPGSKVKVSPGLPPTPRNPG